MRNWAAALLDVLSVLIFVAIGRASHQEGDALLGLATTAWPFLGSLLVGWVAVRGWRAPRALLPTGVAVWVATVAGGMLLRVVAGQGTAVAFIIVATVVLGLFLLGWRALAAAVRRRGRGGRQAGQRARTVPSESGTTARSAGSVSRGSGKQSAGGS